MFDGQPDKDGLVVAGVDFDKVITSAGIASLAEERIKRLGSYVEASVSGSGLHVIIKSASARQRRRPQRDRAVYQGSLLHDDRARIGRCPDRNCSR